MRAPLRSSLVLAFVVVAAMLTSLAGCDMFDAAEVLAESKKHEGPIADEIERAVGKRPSVVSVDRHDLLIVTVSFSEPPPSTPVPELEAVSRTAIVREFKHEPKSLTISFVYQDL